jgi:nitrogen-specific signal transduction histidine kinase/CheY-like chemotaxis protein
MAAQKSVPSKDQSNLKRQIRQLESIAALSGGIAHDYNNLLTAIMGNLSLALEQIPPDAPIRPLLDGALNASRVAKTLTQRLITFSKGGQPTKTASDIVAVVENAAAFSLSGSNINCTLGPAPGIWPAQVDAQQIGQAIHNLIINAAESMPSGGTISIDFNNTVIDHSTGALPVGRYIDIAISDHGTGIAEENIEKIFDPYFSTKGKGDHRGTGLGLSISNSIITNHGGEITVNSRIGKGSTFHVRLPATDDTASAVPPRERIHRDGGSSVAVHGHGKILVMDDEAMILEVAGNLLRHLGYDVEFASAGQEAIEKYTAARDAGTPFDAVILDLTIRGGMGGQETIRKLKQLDPDVKAIVSSGYSDNPVIANYTEYGFCEMVAKPYEMAEFSRTLNRVLTGTRSF